MKKLIVGLLAAFLMTTGLVGFSATTASAACPYQGCFDTRTSSSTKVRGAKVIITVKVRALGTNKNAQGTVLVKIRKKASGKLVYRATKTLRSGRATFSKGGLKRGVYVYTANFKKKTNSAFNGSGDDGRFRITKR